MRERWYWLDWLRVLAMGAIQIHLDEGTGRVVPASEPEEVERTYNELKKNAVGFSQELTTANWGKLAIFRNPDGNEFEIS